MPPATEPAKIEIVDAESFEMPSSIGLDAALCRVLESKLMLCCEPFDEAKEIKGFLHLGKSWISSIQNLTDMLVEAYPACAEAAHELACGYKRYCGRMEYVGTAAALRERRYAARRVIQNVADSATRNLGGREFVSLEVENSFLPFPIKTARPLASEPYLVCIAELGASSAPDTKRSTIAGLSRHHETGEPPKN